MTQHDEHPEAALPAESTIPADIASDEVHSLPVEDEERVHNIITGNVSGAVVQAGDVSGGITIG